MSTISVGEDNMPKKQLIIEKSIELFAKQGFEATSVQQITDYCGISKGAFYLSFTSKDELILELIDHFMKEITSEIDYTVNNVKNDEEVLYKFYYTTLYSFYKHSDFAKIFMKEQTQSFNKELLVKIRYYDSLIEKTIITMLERLYGEDVRDTKYDLMYSIKGFMSTFSELFLFHDAPLDLNLMSQSLMEKTDLLARHSTVPFITEEFMQMFKQPQNEGITKEHILEIMEQKVEEVEESIEKESLILLKQQLLESTYSPAIVKGLLENIRNHPYCKWIYYLLQNYYKF
jgi:AcrR family transcriptional regulator